VIDNYLVERNPERRIEPPRFVFLLVAIDIPFPAAFGQTFQNSIFTTVIATFALVEDTHDIEARLDACLVATIKTSVEDTAEDWRIAISGESIIHVGHRRHFFRTWHDLVRIGFEELSGCQSLFPAERRTKRYHDEFASMEHPDREYPPQIPTELFVLGFHLIEKAVIVFTDVQVNLCQASL